ncbi:sulfatase-like hydrolase/transferase [Paenibacillus sp. IB182496]|uniref:Sulfatase-like hydrolase/transferase n=1 Tax=Paenibacillus sabuli TaxID=2772509 RepID=A0A927GQ15_9BACL|nr:sulfatase-like hydrolase/transferase [Paenibacillus sabuli]MBD2844049.1 sulfatase-like hydrolase/transferase [Paenibacillus sabuli]
MTTHADQRKPNILIFMSDQQRADTIPPYGKAKTPNLDRFCQAGVTFSNAYTISPHCCPSRATFFSGLYPSQHGVWNNVDVGNTLSRGLYEGVRLWSEDLRDDGYELRYHGKWHVSATEGPEHRGFNEPAASVEGYRHARPHTGEWSRYAGGETLVESDERKDGEIMRNGYDTYTHYGVHEDPFNDRATVEEAIASLRQLGSESARRPWCLYAGTLGPHDPYFVPQRYLDQYAIDDIELPPSFYDRMEDKPGLYRKTRGRFDQLTEREHKEAIRHYLAFCTYEDDLFGQVLDELERSGEAANTLVLYLSDHGDYMAEHGLWCKGLPCFRGAYHIPAVIRWPAEVKDPGRVVDEFVNLADFAPTFLEAASIETDRVFAGSSLIPFIRNDRPEAWREAVFTQSNGNELYGIQRSIMTKEWKFVYNGFDYEELYDLREDPHETCNRFGQAEYEPVVRSLSEQLWSFARKVDDVCINPYVMVALAPYGPGVAFATHS